MRGTLNRSANQNLPLPANCLIPVFVPIENPNNQVTFIDKISFSLGKLGSVVPTGNWTLQCVVLRNHSFAEDFPTLAPTEQKIKLDGLHEVWKTFVLKEAANPAVYDLHPVTDDFDPPLKIEAGEKAVVYIFVWINPVDLAASVSDTISLTVKGRQVSQEMSKTLQGFKLNG